jgi:phosphoesterase RecJ-like protein
VRLGVDAAKIHKLIYDTFSENRLRLLGFAISNRMLVWEEFNTALIYLTKTDLNRYKYAVGDTEGLVNYPLMMNKINLSILITEKDNKLRLSMRSKGDFSVNDLARNHFNGGGHKNAAGGNVTGTIDDLIADFKQILPNYKKDLDFQLMY